jgi:hypothetical protein
LAARDVVNGVEAWDPPGRLALTGQIRAYLVPDVPRSRYPQCYSLP